MKGLQLPQVKMMSTLSIVHDLQQLLNLPKKCAYAQNFD